MPPVNTGLGGPTGHGENSFLATSLDAGNYDDGAIEVDITSVFGAGGIDFFGTTYTSLYINSNGLITFAGPNTTYNGTDLASLPEPALAPFWTDHNVTGGDPAGTNNIYWDLDPVNGNVTITWYEVEPYTVSGTNTFQMVLSNEGGGTFGVEYIYEDIGFTNGFGAQAQVGVTDGGSNDFIVPGSGDGTALATFDVDNLDPDSPNGTWDLFVNGGIVVCFLEGTLIETSQGAKPIQWLRDGDLLKTLDHGFQALVKVVESRFVACDKTLPVCISANTLDNDKDLFLSPHHRVLITNSYCDLLFGTPSVFVAAKHLLGLPGVRQETRARHVSYYHLVLRDHEVIFSNARPSESFFAGDMARLALGSTRQQMQSQISESALTQSTARRTLKAHEAMVLVDTLLASGTLTQKDSAHRKRLAR